LCTLNTAPPIPSDSCEIESIKQVSFDSDNCHGLQFGSVFVGGHAKSPLGCGAQPGVGGVLFIGNRGPLVLSQISVEHPLLFFVDILRFSLNDSSPSVCCSCFAIFDDNISSFKFFRLSQISSVRVHIRDHQFGVSFDAWHQRYNLI